MGISLTEIRNRALHFIREHQDDTDEKSQAHDFWRDFFEIWGVSTRKIGVFEDRAKTLAGNTGFIDFFWPKTLLVEHKSRGLSLDGALKQAFDYCIAGGISDLEMPRWVVVSDFRLFRIVDLENLSEPEAQKEFTTIPLEKEPLRVRYAEFALADLHENLHRFNFILGYEKREYKDVDVVNVHAAEMMGRIHDSLLESGFKGHQLEVFLVRLMFCLFADDTGIFPKYHFRFLIEDRTRDDGFDLGPLIAEIFQILDTSLDKRQTTLDPDLMAFPYVNGGLFQEVLPCPSFTRKLRTELVDVCLFDWGKVSPAIFGSLFQSVMDDASRRNLGAHYTSEKNILKTIYPLFMDDLWKEYHGAFGSVRLLSELLLKIKRIKVLDPACGCGNFLILSYRELRLLEIEIHKAIQKITKAKYADLSFYYGIDVDNMYGIELEEFPSQIARVALWITDHLMNVRLSTEFGEYLPRLPLKTSPRIVNENALTMEWSDLIDPSKLTFIVGNPPFAGKKEQSGEQKLNQKQVYSGLNVSEGILDFVSCWYIKSAKFIQDTAIRCAFVSTNSICQGEQVGVLWGLLFQTFHISIHFAHRSFKWNNEASGNAAVYCVIVGFGLSVPARPMLFEYATPVAEPHGIAVQQISPYLTAGNSVCLTRRSSPVSANAPKMTYGSMMIDGGHLVVEDADVRKVSADPIAKKYLRPLWGGEEYIHRKARWCLWLEDADPKDIHESRILQERVKAVRAFRLASGREATIKLAETPSLFGEIRQPKKPYLLIPKVSSETRQYIPIGLIDPSVIASGSSLIIPDATLFHFGVLTSQMHNAWMRAVCGRMKSDYQYSSTIVYNNFPWPECTPTPQMKLTKKAAALVSGVEDAVRKVLAARELYSGLTLADLYDTSAMPKALHEAHVELSKAVDLTYRTTKFKSDLERVEVLFSYYERATAGLFAVTSKRKRVLS